MISNDLTVLIALREFAQSRAESLFFVRIKRLFDCMRDSFGLNKDVLGPHWPGTGTHAEEYREIGKPFKKHHRFVDNVPGGECCALLKNPKAAVRGFLALSRRDAEAGWDIEPALRLTEITSAFLAYVLYSNVFLPEEPLRAQFTEASNLARTASVAITNAKLLEDALCVQSSWNQSVWRFFGNDYGQWRQEGYQAVASATTGLTPLSPCPRADAGDLSCEAALAHFQSLCQPIAMSEISLLGFIPFSRRRVVEVHAPPCSGRELPKYVSDCMRLVTVPAPWTDDEAWRRVSSDTTHINATIIEDPTGPLETEKATIQEPESLALWVEVSAFGTLTPEQVIGTGIRGRWGLFGCNAQEPFSTWWAVELKDFVLPNFWQADSKVGIAKAAHLASL